MPRWLRLALGHAAIAIAVVRIVATYPVFNQTYDEPISVACGMQWLDRGVYLYDQKHPPLGRVAAAFGAYVTGNRGNAGEDVRQVGNAILGHGDYWRNLALARAGVLPFFVLGCWALWAWVAWAAGPLAGLVAVSLFTLLPTVLGHAGLAMTDGVLLGTFTMALWAWCLWLERPSRRRSLLLGAGLGLAVLSNFSGIIFLLACGLPIAVFYARRMHAAGPIYAWSSRVRSGALAALLAAGVIWAGYRFSWQPYDGGQAQPHATLDRMLGEHGLARRLAATALRTPIPAPELFSGMIQLGHHNQESHYNLFLGQYSNTGWWFYYPVMLAVKTPLAFWVLFAVGLVAAWRRGNWRTWALLWPVSAFLLVGLLSHINTGVRHILAIYAPLAAVAALGVVFLLRSNRVARALCVVLLLWLAVDSSLAQPDFLAYFNALADGTSGRFGVASDLDYGQDLARLGPACARHGIHSLALAYYGTVDTERLGLPPHHALAPGVPVSGWVAISMNKLKLGEHEDHPADYAWLESYSPVELVGKSIRLYNIPAQAFFFVAVP